MKLEPSINQKTELLKLAAVQLKKEFIGIDGIIDEVIDVMLPWWVFPNYQMRPLIINLWGMTGSGKTALITRLCELVNYSNYLLRFDMGEFGSNSSFLKYQFTSNMVQYHETAPIIVLDEFQFAKTKDESGKEVNNTSLRIIWDLLDSGKLIYEPQTNIYYAIRAKKISTLLGQLKKMGATYAYGKVTKMVKETHEAVSAVGLGYATEQVNREKNPEPFAQNEIFISDLFCTVLYELNSGSYASWLEVQADIMQLATIEDLQDYIIDINERQNAPRTMDLSRSLVFVVGNLDEAYSMSHNINPDIEADEYKRHTQKITIADIKSALQTRFRNEQIARLGNNHLIYQAFGNKDFKALIALHLKLMQQQINKRFGFTINFTPAVEQLIYAEGVFPTQGVRPVISTVRNLVESNMAKLILYVHANKLKAKTVNWDYSNDQFELLINGKTKFTIPVLQKINSLRKSTGNDLQAVVAVHEAGHCLASLLIVNVVAEYVITRTVDSDSNGFAYIVLPEDILTKRLLLDRIKILLGGYLAEQLIFGKQNNTTGVTADLQQATNLAHQIIREYGMTDEPYKINIHQYGGNHYQFTFTEEHENMGKQIINECRAEVEAALLKHKKLLLIVSEYLSNNSRLNKKQIIEFYKTYCKDQKIKPVQLVDKDSYYNFRKTLQLQVGKS